MGYFMKKCHQDLENFPFSDKITNVLEIGAGNSPHYKFINHPYKKYYIIDTTEIKKNYYKNNPKVLAKKYNGKKIPFKNNFFDRIIISHCLEHINYPEKFIFEMICFLCENSQENGCTIIYSFNRRAVRQCFFPFRFCY